MTKVISPNKKENLFFERIFFLAFTLAIGGLLVWASFDSSNSWIVESKIAKFLSLSIGITIILIGIKMFFNKD